MARIHFIVFAVLVFVLSSCVDRVEEIDEIQKGAILSIQVDATLESFGEADTKATISSTISPKWTADDQITVVNLSTNTVLGNIQTTGTGVKATFQGELNGSAVSGNTLLFVYPALTLSAGSTFNNTMVYYSDAQNGSTAPFAAYSTYELTDTDIAAGSFGPISATFSFLMAYFKLNLSGLPSMMRIDEIEIDDVYTAIRGSRNSTGTGLSLAVAKSSGKVIIRPDDVMTNEQGAVPLLFSCSQMAVGTREILVHSESGVYKAIINNELKRSPNSYTNLIVSDFILAGGTYNNHEYVNLGLPSGTMWATENMGKYYMFGAPGTSRGSAGANVTTLAVYSSQLGLTNKVEDMGTATDPLTKYYRYQASLPTLKDPATASNINDRFGVNWRTPSKEEWNELIENCTESRSTIDGVEYITLTSNVEGYTGQSITLAATSKYASSSFSSTDVTKYVVVSNATGLPFEDVVRYDAEAIRPVFTAFSLREHVLEFDATFGTSTFKAQTVNLDCYDATVSWKLTNQAELPSWIDVSKYASGQGSKELGIAILPNPDAKERMVTLEYEATSTNPIFKGKVFRSSIVVVQKPNMAGGSDSSDSDMPEGVVIP